ncbi:MAG: HD-GYP domain-containing protein [Planctomycetes bacterium]|nr:HD-GYP domain-containing protein [Planctomycetota bacterium]
MRTVRLDTVSLVEPLVDPLYHESGTLVFERGEVPFIGDIITLQKLQVAELSVCETPAEVDGLGQRTGPRLVAVGALTTGDRVASPVYTESGELLVPAGSRADGAMVEELRKFKVREVTVLPDAARREEVFRFATRRREQRKKGVAERLAIDDARMVASEKELAPDQVQEVAGRGQFEFDPADAPLADEVLKDAALARNEEVKRYYLSRYDRNFERAVEFFDLLRGDANGQRIDTAVIGRIAEEIIECLVLDKDLLLCMHHFKRRNYYLVAHTLNVTLITINVAAAMGYSRRQVYEAAYGAFLHDVGMTRIPVEIEEKTTPLTPAEMAEIRDHPQKGLALLRSLSRVPRSTLFAVYQEHERCDGTGYPSQARGPQIHPVAKIVAVADVFDALTSDRPYRKGVKPYSAIETIIKNAHKGLFDTDVVKAFLRYFSLFPVGSWVQLNTQEIAKVMCANPVRYDKPVVRIVFRNEHHEVYANPKLVDLTETANLHVVKAVDAPMDVSESMFWILNLL